MDPRQVTHVLYHGDCQDGFGAAWAAWKALGDAACYLPVQHGDPPPALPPGARVVLVDFSYPRATLLDLRDRVRDLLVLDHHLSSQVDLADLPFARFDLGRSGAALSWLFFHPGEPLPELLAYVEDRDLWRFQLPETREVHNALSTLPFDFATWEGASLQTLREEGRVIARFKDQLVTHLANRAGMGEVGGHRVPVGNCPGELRSDVAHELLERHAGAPFVALWSVDRQGNQGWSLRSRGDFDVAALAAAFGGGGHAAAAGFRRSPGQWILAPLDPS